MDRLAADGIAITFNPEGGIIADLAIDTGGGTLHPLHRAPWVDSGEDLPDTLARVERQLAGDFFCAPFGAAGGGPVHGWTANGDWRSTGESQSEKGCRTNKYQLERAVLGATVDKQLTLCPGHPFLYQSHVFKGGSGHMPVSHHAMIHVPGGARISFSPKACGVTPGTPLEGDPSRGRSILAYPRRFGTLERLELASGDSIDARTYPFAKRHEDMLVLAGRPGDTIGWSAALAARDGFLFFAVKDAMMLPETMLWMSNGGRDYAPWSGRHTAVLGIEEAATACHANGTFTSTGGPSEDGLATGIELAPGKTTTVRYGFGAIAAPDGWTEVAEIKATADTLTLTDIGGETITLPFLGGHFGIAG